MLKLAMVEKFSKVSLGKSSGLAAEAIIASTPCEATVRPSAGS